MAYFQFKSIKLYLIIHGYTLFSGIENFLQNRAILMLCPNNHLKAYLYKDILHRKHNGITICKECHKNYRKKLLEFYLHNIFNKNNFYFSVLYK